MPRQELDEDIDAKEGDRSANVVVELDDAHRAALMEAENEALVLAHEDQDSLPWHFVDLFFRPRLATLRWTQAADDRLRDRAVAIAALEIVGGILAITAAGRFPKLWGERLEFVLWTFASFLLLCFFFAGTAKVYDAIGRGLGAQSNYDRIRVVIAMTYLPQIIFGIPYNLLRIFFGDAPAGQYDHSSMPEGVEWLFVGAYAVWLIYFPILALQTVQLFPLGKAIGNHLAGAVCSAIFWAVVGTVIFFVVKLFYWIFNMGTFGIF